MTADSFARLVSVVRPGWVPEEPEEPDDSTRHPAWGGPQGRDDADLADGPAHRLPGRSMPRRVGLSAMAAAAAVVVALVGRGLLSDAGAADTVPAVPRSAGAERTAAQAPAVRASRTADPARPGTSATDRSPMVVGSGPTAISSGVVVHVVGRVRRPGLVTLATGARVADAVTAAGGATSGAALQRINLARFLADGEQLVVPGPGDPLPAEGGAGAGIAGPGTGGVGPAQPIDLNTATEAQLDELPGVGPVTAARIIAWRREHQRFTRVEELGEVDGIGAKMLERLRPLVRV